MIDIQELHSIDALNDLAPVWNELHNKTSGASFFQTLPWLETYNRYFGKGKSWHIFVLSENEKPFTIVPLLVKKEHFSAGTARVLTYPLDDWGSFYGPIGERPQLAIATVLEHLKKAPRDWDILDLRWVAPYLSSSDEEINEGKHSSGAAITEGAFQKAGYKYRRHLCKQTAVIDTTGTWEDYLASRRGKFRSELRRSIRRTEALGNIEFERFRPEAFCDSAAVKFDPHWEDYDACVALAESSWQGGSTDGTTLSHKSVSEFLRECHGHAAKLGMLDMNLLRINGELAAFAYNYHHKGYVYGLRVGYNPAFAKTGVGKVLWARSFEDSFNRDDILYDIGPDSLQVKKHWWTRLLDVHGFAHYANTPQAQLVRVSHWWKDRKANPNAISSQSMPVHDTTPTQLS